MDSKGKSSCDSNSEGLMLIKTLKARKNPHILRVITKIKAFSRDKQISILCGSTDKEAVVYTHLLTDLSTWETPWYMQTPKVKEHIISASLKYSIKGNLCFLFVDF